MSEAPPSPNSDQPAEDLERRRRERKVGRVEAVQDIFEFIRSQGDTMDSGAIKDLVDMLGRIKAREGEEVWPRIFADINPFRERGLVPAAQLSLNQRTRLTLAIQRIGDGTRPEGEDAQQREATKKIVNERLDQFYDLANSDPGDELEIIDRMARVLLRCGTDGAHVRKEVLIKTELGGFTASRRAIGELSRDRIRSARKKYRDLEE